MPLFIPGSPLRNHNDQAIYEVPDIGRRKKERSRSWRDSGDGYVSGKIMRV